MDEAVTLRDCDVYSYKSDGEDDPFGAPQRSPATRIQAVLVAVFTGKDNEDRVAFLRFSVGGERTAIKPRYSPLHWTPCSRSQHRQASPYHTIIPVRVRRFAWSTEAAATSSMKPVKTRAAYMCEVTQ